MQVEEVLKKLKDHTNPKNVVGMTRFGINPHQTLGVAIPVLRGMAKQIGKNHLLAQRLWDSGIHEARILAGFIDDAKLVTEKQMEEWVKDFDSWDVCDQVCSNLFDKNPLAFEKAIEWSHREEEFVRRAGFVMMATLAVHAKKSTDEDFKQFFPLIIKHSTDERNFVKKAVNWALRQMGKRNFSLNKAAIETAQEVLKLNSKSAKWIANDALRELKSTAVQQRLCLRNHI